MRELNIEREKDKWRGRGVQRERQRKNKKRQKEIEGEGFHKDELNTPGRRSQCDGLIAISGENDIKWIRQQEGFASLTAVV